VRFLLISLESVGNVKNQLWGMQNAHLLVSFSDDNGPTESIHEIAENADVNTYFIGDNMPASRGFQMWSQTG